MAVDFILTGTTTYNVPAGATVNKVEGIGSGGRGSVDIGYGGGGGAYCAKYNPTNFTDAGNPHACVVGAGNGTADTIIKADNGTDNVINAGHGYGGDEGDPVDKGNGGTATGGDVNYSGGKAGDMQYGGGGAGGGAAGPHGPGGWGGWGSLSAAGPGGGGGGADGGQAGMGGAVGGAGGASGLVGSTGGVAGTGSTSPTSGTLGAGGGASARVEAGADGSSGDEWSDSPSYGCGGGGGGGYGDGDEGTGADMGDGGNGAPYGGGGAIGGWSNGNSGAPGDGADGLIIITYNLTVFEKTVIIASGTSWNVPADFGSLVLIEAIGGGAGGSSGPSAGNGAVGGGGGAYVRITGSDITLNANDTLYLQIGQGGASNTAGTDTWLNKSANQAPTQVSDGVLAKGGVNNGAGSTATAAGGLASASVGSTKYNGGDASARTLTGTATGGGGAAGRTADGGANHGSGKIEGGDGSGSYAGGGVGGDVNGVAGTNGTQGNSTHDTSGDASITYVGAGGGGAGRNSTDGVGSNGGLYGAGGGGGRGNGTAGGSGANGVIVFTYLTAEEGGALSIYFNTDVVDSGLNEIVSEASTVFVCNSMPTTYTEASSTYALGSAAITINSPGASTQGDGRKVTSNPITGGSITADGTVSYWAVCDASRLLAAGGIDAPEAVTNGWEFSLGALSLVLPFQA